jgi:AmmeMemoRadiSam system protein B
MTSPVRAAAVAGTWYPADPRALVAELDGCLAGAAAPAPPGRLVALIAPHAGLRYSGPVAAHAYALLRARPPRTVVMVGPSHRVAFDGASVYARGAWETPLGRAAVDEEAAAAILRAGGGTFADERAHRDEHSLEMQMPFVRHVAPGARIVPMLMGTQSRAEVDALAGALVAGLAGRDALLVASSDLSHYHPRPAAQRRDAEVVADVEAFAPERLLDRLERAPDHACGGGPMVAVMLAARARGADRATVLRYADSGEAGERDTSRVVGYLAAALTAGPA